nr:hypothetical protein [uncultured bacterium]
MAKKAAISISLNMLLKPLIVLKLVSQLWVSIGTPIIDSVATMIIIMELRVICTSSPAAQILAVTREKMPKYLAKSNVREAINI